MVGCDCVPGRLNPLEESVFKPYIHDACGGVSGVGLGRYMRVWIAQLHGGEFRLNGPHSEPEFIVDLLVESGTCSL